MQPANIDDPGLPNKFPSFKAGQDQIGDGSVIVLVNDTALANALISVGIPLRQDPPYTHVQGADGKDRWTFNFYPASEDGRITTNECIKGWKGDLEWVKANPNHPFAYTMVATKNFLTLREHQRTATPYVAFNVPTDNGSATMLVQKGSKKHQAAIQKGYQQL